MEIVIHAFIGVARPAAERARKGVMLIVRADEPGVYDWERAKELIAEEGFEDVELSGAGRVDPERIATNEKDRRRLEKELAVGPKLVVYDAVAGDDQE